MSRLLVFGGFAHDPQGILAAIYWLALMAVEECPNRMLRVGFKLRVAALAYANHWRGLLYNAQLAVRHNSSLAYVAEAEGEQNGCRLRSREGLAFECWTLRVEMMFPSNTRLTEVEGVTIFKMMHGVRNVMADLRLKFTNKTTEYLHLVGRQESGLLQSPAVSRYRVEAVVKVVQALIRPEFSSKMVSSQFAPPCASWSGRRSCEHTSVARLGYSRCGVVEIKRHHYRLFTAYSRSITLYALNLKVLSSGV